MSVLEELECYNLSSSEPIVSGPGTGDASRISCVSLSVHGMYLVCSMHMVCSWYVHVMLLARGLRSFSLPSHLDHVLLSSCRSGPKTPPSTVAQGPSDLLTALSMSYGGGPPRKQEKQGEEKRDQVTHRARRIFYLF